MNVQIVIPARLASTRLPEKMLLEVAGKPIVQHTYEAARRSRLVQTSSLDHPIIVAVDDPRLAAAVDGFGGHARLTSPQCNTGTDRVAEIAQDETTTEIFLNVQGDEPEIDPAAIDLVADALIDDPTADMATIVTPLRDADRIGDPACVKAMVDARGRAVYFSRGAIPHARDGITPLILDQDPPAFYQHVGIYAYRRQFLAWFSQQPPGTWEQIEKLEQLRATQAGKTILARVVASAQPGIDTLDDFQRFADRIQNSASNGT